MLPRYTILVAFLLTFACSEKSSAPQSQGSATAYSTSEARGWKYTRFGMTAAQVVEASGGKAKIPEEPTPGVIALSEHSTGPFVFDVAFLSNNSSGTLTGVRLELCDSAMYVALKASLEQRHGYNECHRFSKAGILGVPEGVERCFWSADGIFIDLRYSITRVVGWAPKVDLQYSEQAEDGL